MGLVVKLCKAIDSESSSERVLEASVILNSVLATYRESTRGLDPRLDRFNLYPHPCLGFAVQLAPWSHSRQPNSDANSN